MHFPARQASSSDDCRSHPAPLQNSPSFVSPTRQVRHKAWLLAYGAVVMVVTSDMKWNKKKLPDPDAIKGAKGNKTKRVSGRGDTRLIWRLSAPSLLPVDRRPNALHPLATAL